MLFQVLILFIFITKWPNFIKVNILTNKLCRFVFSLCLSHLVVSFLSITISFVSIFLPYSPTVSTYKGSHYVSVGEDGHLLSANSLLTSGKGSNGGSLCSTNGVDLAHLIMMHINFGVAVCTSITVALISTERWVNRCKTFLKIGILIFIFIMK